MAGTLSGGIVNESRLDKAVIDSLKEGRLEAKFPQ